ncbi:hypothetical protein B0H14DRAFT_2563160 [Mycena olivaceomarginata]|nr:hypothetical protein B0H14DRAFT_2584039 [Mycena olivaceomarginata]KAJ7886852.1 hypothetical protein B0H14DRAFT_2563160 [Mycena olivaceomarginata]
MIACENDNRGSQPVKGCCQTKAKERSMEHGVIGQSGRKKDAGEQKEKIQNECCSTDNDLTWVDPQTQQNQRKHQNWGGTTGKGQRLRISAVTSWFDRGIRVQKIAGSTRSRLQVFPEKNIGGQQIAGEEESPFNKLSTYFICP